MGASVSSCCCGSGCARRRGHTRAGSGGDGEAASGAGGGNGSGTGKRRGGFCGSVGAYCCCCCPRVVRHRAYADEEEKIPIVEAPGAMQLPRREPSLSAEQMTRSPESGKGTEVDLLTRGKKLFNSSPDKGIRFLQQNELVGNTPVAVATFLRDATFLDKVKIGEYLGGHDEFHLAVLESYTALQNFDKMPFDSALRKFLASFRLPGEAQKIERIMERFAATYTARNPGVFVNSDTAFVLAFSLIMLNTDLHNPNVKHRMTKANFIKNNRGINNGADLPDDFLTTLYDSFKNEQLVMDEGVTFTDVGYTFFNTERAGYLWKLNANLVGWNRRYFVITGNVLYYFKTQEEKTPSAIIPLEQLAVREVELAGVLDMSSGNRFAFELYNPDNEGSNTGTIKAVKRSGGTLSSSAHKSFIFASDSAEDRSDWIRAIRSNMAPRQMYQMVKAHRGRASGAMPLQGGADSSDVNTPAFAAATAAAADATSLSLSSVPDTLASASLAVASVVSTATRSAPGLAPDMSPSFASAGPPTTATPIARNPSAEGASAARPPMVRAPSQDAGTTPRPLSGSTSTSTDAGDVPVLSPPPSAAIARLRSNHGRSASDTAGMGPGPAVDYGAAPRTVAAGNPTEGSPPVTPAAPPPHVPSLAAQVLFSAGAPKLADPDIVAGMRAPADDGGHIAEDNDGDFLLRTTETRTPAGRRKGRKDEERRGGGGGGASEPDDGHHGGDDDVGGDDARLMD